MDALDVLIEQERLLITHYETRQARAEAAAAAAITAVLALAALTTTANSGHVDQTYGWIVVGALALACGVALWVRSAGLRHTRHSFLSTESETCETALKELRGCHHLIDLDPIDVRQLTLALCVARAGSAREAARSKDRWAAGASIALALSVVLTAALKLLTA
jgi:hypothetical protein